MDGRMADGLTDGRPGGGGGKCGGYGGGAWVGLGLDQRVAVNARTWVTVRLVDELRRRGREGVAEGGGGGGGEIQRSSMRGERRQNRVAVLEIR